MGLENKTLNNIDVKFAQADIQKPNVWWEYGTLWADTNDQKDVELIKEGLEEVINSSFKVKVSKLGATDSEPWDQYAFDIVEANNVLA
jgi:hypothetical protein